MAEGSNSIEQPQVQVLLDERNVREVYTNAYRIHTTVEEVFVDVGINFPYPNAQDSAHAQVLFKVSDRLIMSYASAKRLAASLSQLIKHWEQRHGEAGGSIAQRR